MSGALYWPVFFRPQILTSPLTSWRAIGATETKISESDQINSWRSAPSRRRYLISIALILACAALLSTAASSKSRLTMVSPTSDVNETSNAPAIREQATVSIRERYQKDLDIGQPVHRMTSLVPGPRQTRFWRSCAFPSGSFNGCGVFVLAYGEMISVAELPVNSSMGAWKIR